MGKGILICLFLFIAGVQYCSIIAQTQDTIPVDGVRTDSLEYIAKKIVQSDSIPFVQFEDSVIPQKKATPEFKPNATKAVLLTAVVPGLGQIYNRKYWKLPLVYGGLAGITYAISWNGNYYNDYSDAYESIVSGGDKWKDFYIGKGFDTDNLSESQLKTIKSSLKRKRDFYRRNRDLAIISLVAFYALCMVDAYVDAQLAQFDVSPDLSMHVEPVVWMPTSYSGVTIGLQCRITF